MARTQADRDFDLAAGRNIERVASLLDAAKKARWALEFMVERYGPDIAGMALDALNDLDRAIRRADEQAAHRAEVECVQCGAKATFGSCCRECGRPTDE